MRRFIGCSEENIRRSDKKRIASASYGGAMIDILMVVKSALGKWAVGEILDELEGWQKDGGPEGPPQVRVDVRGGSGKGAMSPETLKSLGDHIARWLEGQKEDGKGRPKDPMFA